MNITMVAGNFSASGGSQSSWASKLATELTALGATVSLMNGGSLTDLDGYARALPDSGVVLWFADVPNDQSKIVTDIKVNHPKVLLVTSKRNQLAKYSFSDLVAQALNTKSNLLVELTGPTANVLATIMDPLGNLFLDQDPNIANVASALYQQLNILLSFTRQASVSVGAAKTLGSTPDVDKFIQIIVNQANSFHDLINPRSKRMLGNAAFRCESGFPAVKNVDGYIYVTQRNIDKALLTREAFVAIQPGSNGIEYFGSNKPSVDSPIQLALFAFFTKVKYILHSHTYIAGAPTTAHFVPCGAIEEVEEIKALNSNPNATNFCINLKGHGSLVLADSLDYLASVKWIARPAPELM
jgi:hypothetical protein